MHNLYESKSEFISSSGEKYQFYSLKKLKQKGFNIDKLPISIRIILESVLRNYDNVKINEEHVKQLASWQPNEARNNEIPFIVARIVLQDFTGVPLLVDLAAMRSVANNLGKDPKIIEPLVPVNLVVDHSVQVDSYGNEDSLRFNMELEFKRNYERYEFIKWGMQAFDTFSVVPPGVGIVHQVNLEHFFTGLQKKGNLVYPDTLVGTDSHTTMINGVGVVGWGVGGIEAEAGMLGQPVYFLTPDVVGVELKGQLLEGVTATDLVLSITELLRKAKVVGKFVEFYGDGVSSLTVTDRATISNMAPEYGATMGYFPVDQETVNFLKSTGKSKEDIEVFETYFKTQELFGIPKSGQIEYSQTILLNLSEIVPCLSGPLRPQDRINLTDMKETFIKCFSLPTVERGFNKQNSDLNKRFEVKDCNFDIGHGDLLIAAITSCTNTSNPNVMLAAGLLAKKAVENGLTVNKRVKTSLAPGSRVVTEYLKLSGLLPYLEQLGFYLAGYGCTTCIGNSGDLKQQINEVITANDLICSAVLSGNRNFEARVHPIIRANFLASPPLVVAFAIAGTTLIDLNVDPIGKNKDNKNVYLKDIWPSSKEISDLLKFAQDPQLYKRLYSNLTAGLDLWNNIKSSTGNVYSWPQSTYISKPPFFDDFSMNIESIKSIKSAKALLVLGDSVTTDHISPAGQFKSTHPAGQYLIANNVKTNDFNSYGARRGNHDVMMRGTFANVRIKNLMIPLRDDKTRVEGGYTIYNNKQVDIFTAAMGYIKNNIPTVIFAGEEYGTGSSRDWAAKGTLLLGVKIVIARSFERIHRSNLVGMGVLPLQFKKDDCVDSLKINGTETFDILNLNDSLTPQQDITLVIKYANGETRNVELLSRIDTLIEIEYYRHGGILPYVLRQLLNK